MIDWYDVFAGIGKKTLLLMAKDGRCLDDDAFAQLLVDKSIRYGAKPIREWGPLGVVIRISSKWGRYETMTTTTQNPDGLDESINDTLQDIVGYCVLGLLLISEPIVVRQSATQI